MRLPADSRWHAMGIPALAWFLGCLFVAGAATPSAAERWLCPECPGESVERAPGEDLECCGKSWSAMDLSPPVAWINSRTRDTEVAWIIHPAPDCTTFRLDGLLAADDQGPVWLPWILVDWWIPRMRVVRMTDGRELYVGYLKGADCPDPPRFTFDVVDSTSFMVGAPPSAFVETKNESLSELFIVARSQESMDSARVRFVEEVEAGKHPKLPRTQPKLYKPKPVHLPPGTVVDTGEAVVEVRVHEARGVLNVRLVSGTGDPGLDMAVLQAARSSIYVPGGEMGVAVPAWVRVHARFDSSGARLESEPAPQGFWRR